MPLSITNKQQIFKGKFLELWSSTFLDKTDAVHEWEWVKKKDFVIAFAITKDGKILLIKNYRVPVEQYVIEITAGCIETADVTHEDTARRELLEETGYAAEQFIALPRFPTNQGSMLQYAYPFIATGATRVSHASGDATEDIFVLEVAPEELIGMYMQGDEDRGALFNVRILAFYFIAREMGFVK